MIKSGNSFEDKTSDTFIREAIKKTLENLKTNTSNFQTVFSDGSTVKFETHKNAVDLLKTTPKFKAVFGDGSTVNFDIYEDAMRFLTKNPKCKVFVR